MYFRSRIVCKLFTQLQIFAYLSLRANFTKFKRINSLALRSFQSVVNSISLQKLFKYFRKFFEYLSIFLQNVFHSFLLSLLQMFVQTKSNRLTSNIGTDIHGVTAN